MERYSHPSSALVGGPIASRNRAAVGMIRRALARLICLASIYAAFSFMDGFRLDAAETSETEQLVATRQCDRCGFGVVRLETSAPRHAVSVGYLTDDDLARISALLEAARRNAAEGRYPSTPYLRADRNSADIGSTGRGTERTPRQASASAASVYEALAKGGGLTASNVSIPGSQANIGGVNYDDGAWFSLTLRTPQFVYQTIYSP